MAEKLVNRRRMLTGSVAGSAAMMATAAFAGHRPPGGGDWAGATGVLPPSQFADAMKTGARADGKTDDQPALQKLFDGLQEGSVVSFPPGRYHLGRPLALNTGHVSLLGYGAFFDNTLVLEARELRVVGISVIGAPGNGFHILGGQGGHYEALSAQHNGAAGFLIGGADGSQVAWTAFHACNALRNKGDGWLLDASFRKNFVNANLFSGCWSRANGKCGWRSIQRAHYNNWIGTQVEGNCTGQQDIPPVVLGGINNFLFGGHVVDTNKCGTSVRFERDRDNMIFGGRYFGGIEGGNYTQAVVMDAAQEKAAMARKAMRRGAGQDNDDDPSQ